MRPFDDRLAHPTGRVWTRLEFLLWATTGQNVYPGITSSPPGTPLNFAGIIPNPGTEVLFPRDRANNEFRGGFRLTSGIWLDDTQTTGLEGDFFFVNTSKKGLTVASDSNGNQILARPFINAQTGGPAAIVAAFPGVARRARRPRRELGGRRWREPAHRHRRRPLQPVRPHPRATASSAFTTRCRSNRTRPRSSLSPAFHSPRERRCSTGSIPRISSTGPSSASAASADRASGSSSGRTTVAFGGVKQVVITDGRTVITPASGLPQVTFQGLYAQSSNIGMRERTWFAILPEITLRLGVQFSESTRFYFGYNWMYLSSVVRAGDQIDVRVNPDFLPGGPAVVTGPQLPNLRTPQKTDFWMQGVNFGMEIRF